eukprot:TRINITY_DN7599_c0_g2_i1.p1 TRINITY_DN7599_c0_g2~~TRINITY_DN7599_c0_g2_i1.p1  ORF type:complete len:775 (-),score=135.15 TRINITY_DN7599_c0_g2_i1:157-2415(-)
MSRFLGVSWRGGVAHAQLSPCRTYKQHNTVKLASFIAKPYLYRSISMFDLKEKVLKRGKFLIIRGQQNSRNEILENKQMIYIQSSQFSTKNNGRLNQESSKGNNNDKTKNQNGYVAVFDGNQNKGNEQGGKIITPQNKQEKKKKGSEKSKNLSSKSESQDEILQSQNGNTVVDLSVVKITKNKAQNDSKKSKDLSQQNSTEQNLPLQEAQSSPQNTNNTQNGKNIVPVELKNESLELLHLKQNGFTSFQNGSQNASKSPTILIPRSSQNSNSNSSKQNKEDSLNKSSTKSPKKKNVDQEVIKQSLELLQALDQLPEEEVESIISVSTSSKIYGKVPVSEIKGIGVKHENLLKEAGCASIWKLLFLFQYRFACDTDLMKGFFKELGINNHHNMIISHLQKDLVRNSVITLEGNIGAGKTTFLKALSPYINSKIRVFEEPVAEWQEVNNTVKISPEQPEHFNLLQEFYAHPDKAFQFQTYVLGTKIGNQAYTSDPFAETIEVPDFTLKKMKMVHLLERSVFADRLVFVRSLHENGRMNDQEVSIYDHWFNTLVNSQKTNLVPDGFVYLRAEPSVCVDRMRRRNRAEESNVDYSYLDGLHSMHEEWLHNGGVRRVDDEYVKDLLMNRRRQRFQLLSSYGQFSFMEHDKVQELIYEALDIDKIQHVPQIPQTLLSNDLAKVHFLDPRQKQYLNKYPGMTGVPTLEIDWNQDWDIFGDMKRQQEIANIVSDFVDWVSRYKVLIRLPELLPSQFTYRE